MEIRLAVGANSAELLAMVVTEGWSVILSGSALGLLMATAAFRVSRGVCRAALGAASSLNNP